MIRLSSLFCKLIKNKKSAATYIEESFKSVNLSLEVCPHCGSRGNCVNYGTYTRNLVDYYCGEIVCETVNITRVICKSCSGKGHKCTHALLSDAIVPYSQYSLFFILYVLLLYHCRHRTIKSLCEQFEIADVQFYRWKRLFDAHKEEWLGVLSSAETDCASWMKQLVRIDPYSVEFSTRFLHRTTRSFMQNHANPANCRYPKFPGGPVHPNPTSC